MVRALLFWESECRNSRSHAKSATSECAERAHMCRAVFWGRTGLLRPFSLHLVRMRYHTGDALTIVCTTYVGNYHPK